MVVNIFHLLMLAPLVLMFCVSDLMAQTFQYSHGWTTGKRGDKQMLMTRPFGGNGNSNSNSNGLAHNDKIHASEEDYMTLHDAANILRRKSNEDGKRVCSILLSLADAQNCLNGKEDLWDSDNIK